MTLNIHLFPCLNDNYGLLIRDDASGRVATIDTPDADAILAELARLGWGDPDLILNTHWHADHAAETRRCRPGPAVKSSVRPRWPGSRRWTGL